MLKINPCIRMQEKNSYIKDEIGTTVTVDCSEGSNPYGFSPRVWQAWDEIRDKDELLYDYPHGTALKDAIAQFWVPYVNIGQQNITLCNGTIDGLYMVNQLFRSDAAVMLGISPQFPGYLSNVRMNGITYRSITLEREVRYRFCCEEFIQAMDESCSVVYLDNPNNPTGQMISLSNWRKILDKAHEYNICVISDEAYGDYFQENESAATLLNEYENLVVIRTFSKGFGLAGVRVGYVLSSLEMGKELNKLTNPYAANTVARYLAIAALADSEFVQQSRTAFARSKQKIRENLGKNLFMSHTLDACPIFLLNHRNPDVDLETELMRYGIKTYSGVYFDALDQSSVRLRIPHERDMNTLLSALREISC